MRHTIPILALALAAAACGGGGAATGPSDPGGPSPAFASLTVDPPSATLAPGRALPLSATPLDAGGSPVSGLPAPQWRSSDDAVATVSAQGTVSAVRAGTATITASLTADGVTREASAQITVASEFAALRLSHTDFTLGRGAAAQLTATPLDGSGGPLAGLPAAGWQSSAPGVATIASGMVTAVSEGAAVITATLTHQGVTRSASVRVTVTGTTLPSAATVHGIHDGFSPASVTIAVGGTVTWIMSGDEEHDITWDGAAPPSGNIARLDEGEQATRSFPNAGTYTYHCDHHDSRVESGTVVVETGGGAAPPVLTSVTVAPSPGSVAIGGTLQLTATARDQYGNPMAGVPAATWQTGDAARATVSGTGLVTGVAAGAVTVTASVSHDGTTRSGTTTVNVGSSVPGTATVATVDRTFSPRSVTIAAGGTVTWQFNGTHNVTFLGTAPVGGNIGNTSSGSVSRQFSAAGSYGYECSLHSGMTGTVVVQ